MAKPVAKGGSNTTAKAQEPVYPAFVENVHAPIVYFDVPVSYGSLNGVIQVDLGAQVNSPLPRGQGVHTSMTSVARIRCSPGAAAALRDSLNLALQTLSEPKTVPPKSQQQ